MTIYQTKQNIRIYFAALLVLILITQSYQLSAQVNTEALRRDTKKSGMANQVSLGYQLHKGNTNFNKYQFGYRADIFAEHIYAFLSSNLQYKEGNGEVIAHNGFAHLRLIHDIFDMVAIEGFSQIQFDNFIAIRERYLVGAGARINIFNHSIDSIGNYNLRCYLGIGGMQESENYLDNLKSDASLFRTTNYLSIYYDLDKRVNIQSISYFQAAVNKLNNYRLLNDTTLKFKIFSALSLALSLNYRYDSLPPIGIENYDFEISNGLIIEF